ncbi:MAG TPA: hypothetical protein V6D22_07270 [Candidatus Obscuribacterales bacterium]
MVAPVKDAYDLDHFSLQDMTECGMALRKLGADAKSMEDVCHRTVKFLFDCLTSEKTEGKACALVRSYVTAPLGQLTAELQKSARTYKKDVAADARCLVLMGARGIKQEWSDARSSKNTLSIPLECPEMPKQLPMVAELVSQLGVAAEKPASSGAKFLASEKQRTFNVFYVPDATSPAAIPDQQGFVQPNNLKSVVGYGGVLPSGNLFTVIAFLRAPISHQAALAFRPFALNTKIALLPFDEPDLMFSRH